MVIYLRHQTTNTYYEFQTNVTSDILRVFILIINFFIENIPHLFWFYSGKTVKRNFW